MMRAVIMIVLLAFIAVASTKELAVNITGDVMQIVDKVAVRRQPDVLGDKLVSMLIDRLLDWAIKTGQVAFSANASPRPLLPLRSPSYSNPSDSALHSWMSFRPHLRAEATSIPWEESIQPKTIDWSKRQHDEAMGQEFEESLRLTLRCKVALTREQGKNDKMRALLENRESNIECVELPCIMFAPGEDIRRLGQELKLHDVVVISSPQSASVFVEEWSRSGSPHVNVASVGRGTSKVLEAAGIFPQFEPSDATAKVLARELPKSLGDRVLYPTSDIAKDTLQSDLKARGFVVTRLNTYTTKPSVWTEEERRVARSVDVVAFASPSAVRIWAERVGTNFTAVVIGPTSAMEAEAHGFRRVVAPKGSKGVEAWADTILKGLKLV